MFGNLGGLDQAIPWDVEHQFVLAITKTLIISSD
ncbi:hypothetical protein ABIB50_002776 [Mucilaginibacter sp. UYCu711]